MLEAHELLSNVLKPRDNLNILMWLETISHHYVKIRDATDPIF